MEIVNIVKLNKEDCEALEKALLIIDKIAESRNIGMLEVFDILLEKYADTELKNDVDYGWKVKNELRLEDFDGIKY